MAILADQQPLVRAHARQKDWRFYLRTAIRSADELAAFLEIPREAIDHNESGQFPLFVPEPFLKRIAKSDLNDPLLKQVLPVNQESTVTDGYSTDPILESEYGFGNGVIKKYGDRALLLVNGSCAIHCRYCFRRHFPYDQHRQTGQRWKTAIETLIANPQIHEVVLSGGDPLTTVDELLAELFDQLNSIHHIERIRIHTRLPIVIPNRITDEFLQIITESNKDIIMVVHCNHANEIDDEVRQFCCQLKRTCSALLNQSVLLRGINDDLQSLIDLSERLFASGVLPYYLHQLDPVAGAAHFEVPVESGIRLIKQLRASLSGFLVPRYVREIPGVPNKTVLA